jgi:type I restriction enzyme, S subunit
MKWEKVNLGDVATFINGYPFKPTEWSTEGLEIIRIQNLTKGSSETNYFKGSVPEKYKIVKGDILISWSATLDIFVWEGNDAWLNQHIFKVVFDKIEIDRQFFIYLIKHILDDMRKEVHGATMKHITKGKFDNLKVPLPPLPIQKRIAEILDAADALKRKDQELLKKYDELAQAIFIDMFGDPVKNEKGWEVKKLGTEFKSIRYGTGSPPNYSESGIPFLRATNVKAGRIEKKGMVFLSEREAQKIAKCFVNEGDLIIVRSGANTGDCAYISEEYANCLAGYDLIVEMEKVKSRFYNFFLNSIWGKAIIEKLSRRAGQPHLNSEQVSNIECIAPDYSVLEKFKAEIDIIERVRKLSIETSNVNTDLFNSLIHKAFNGELVN